MERSCLAFFVGLVQWPVLSRALLGDVVSNVFLSRKVSRREHEMLFLLNSCVGLPVVGGLTCSCEPCPSELVCRRVANRLKLKTALVFARLFFVLS